MNKQTELFTAAVKMAGIAAQISQHYFRQAITINTKAGNSPVTLADCEIERTLREWLHNHYPEHGIIGEEFANKQSNSEYTWVIDPIDGTVAFTTGKPVFSTLIALLKNNQPIIGIIDQAVIAERFSGVSGESACLNGQVIKSSSQTELSHARLNATTPYMFTTEAENEAFARLKDQVKLTAWGGDAYAYGLLAAGHIDIIMEAQLQYYDVAALIPIIQMSGGVITDWQGNDLLSNNFKGQCLASANPKLHEVVLKIINL